MRNGLLVTGRTFLHPPPVWKSPFMTLANAPLPDPDPVSADGVAPSPRRCAPSPRSRRVPGLSPHRGALVGPLPRRRRSRAP